MPNHAHATATTEGTRVSFTIGLTLMTLWSAALLSGCCDTTQADECHRLVTVINQGIPDMGAVGKASKLTDNAKEVRKIALKFDDLSREVEALTLTSPEIVAHRDAYRDMLTDIALNARALAEVFESIEATTKTRDADKMNALQQRLEATNARFEAAVAQEQPIIDALNATCQRR